MQTSRGRVEIWESPVDISNDSYFVDEFVEEQSVFWACGYRVKSYSE